MIEFLSADDFMPRGNCGQWSTLLQYLYIIPNLLIWLAYAIIPISLLFYLRHGKAVFGSLRYTLLFAAFIFACGTGHIIENVGAFWWPNYRFFAAWHWITAIISLWTAFTLPRYIASLIERPTKASIAEAARRMTQINSHGLTDSDCLKRLTIEIEALKQLAGGQ